MPPRRLQSWVYTQEPISPATLEMMVRGAAPRSRVSGDENLWDPAGFRAGIADLNERLGGSPTRWRWDEVHHAVCPHQGLDAVRPLRKILSRSIPSRGDWSTVNVGPVSADRPYDQVSIPGYRQIVDLSPANDSRFADAVGQSGHFLSPHYDDFLRDWQAVRHKKMRMERSEIDAGALGTLRLVPAAR